MSWLFLYNFSSVVVYLVFCIILLFQDFQLNKLNRVLRCFGWFFSFVELEGLD